MYDNFEEFVHKNKQVPLLQTKAFTGTVNRLLIN